MRALLVVDHGSRRAEANETLTVVVQNIRELYPDLIVCLAHMELAQPDIKSGVADCLSQGAREIIIHPFMLAPGRHVTEDIPRMVKEALGPHPEIIWRVTLPLAPHPLLAKIVLERAELD